MSLRADTRVRIFRSLCTVFETRAALFSADLLSLRFGQRESHWYLKGPCEAWSALLSTSRMTNAVDVGIQLDVTSAQNPRVSGRLWM